MKTLLGETYSFHEQVIYDIEKMMKYLLQSGVAVPDEVIKDACSLLQTSDEEIYVCAKALRVHNDLSQLIKPAVPRGIFGQESSAISRLTNSPFIVWQMLFISIFFILAIIGLSSSGYVTPTNIEAEHLYANGLDSLAPSLYLLMMAGLGATFYNLWVMYKFIINSSYDPKFVSSYWVRLFLGIVAGYTISQLVDLGIGDSYGKPLLALLGGYSVEVVNWALARLIDTLKTLILGASKAKEEELHLKLQEELSLQKVNVMETISNEIFEAKLRLQNSEAKDDSFSKELDQLYKDISSKIKN